MAEVFIKKLNNVKVQVVAEPHVLKEIEDCYKFRPPGYQFVPSYKNRYWDGYVRLLDARPGFVYLGLWQDVKTQCEARGYSVEVDETLLIANDVPDTSGYDLAELFEAKYTPRDYQNEAVVHALKNKRGLLLSPTASGKSFIIYLIARYLVEELNQRVLLIVPTVSLVTQMRKDFIDYNNGIDIGIHSISAGASKQSDLPVTISTWQSLQRVSKDYMDQYDCIMVDEAHGAKATVISKLLEKADCEWKLGFTGTIPDDGPVNQLTLEGLFGPIYQVTRTHKLIEDSTLANFQIKALVLEHPKLPKPDTYQSEIDTIVSSQSRNKFICNLAENTEGNTLILFNYVERHGDVLHDLIKNSKKKNIFYVHGGIKADEREEIRQALEKSNNNVLLASLGTTSTGVNIVNLDNVIFAHPTKSKIRNLQSIGRVLRKNGDKQATLYDLVDDLRAGRKFMNYSLKHFEERSKQYRDEKFKVKYYTVPLK